MWRGLVLLDDHGLDGRDDAVLDLDLDHARPDGADRLLEVDLAAVDRDAAGLLDRVDDVLRRDRAEQAAVVARLVRDRQHGAVQRLGGLARGGRRLGEGALGGLLALGRGGDGALGRRRRDLARDQVVAQVALRDVDDRPAGAELLVVLQEDRFRHLRYLAVAIAAAATTAAFALVAAGALADVREQRELTRALDRRRDLVLMPAARARDPARPDLAAVGDELAQGGDVLVVDELHLVAAVLAGLPASAAPSGLCIPPARRPAGLLCHCWKTSQALVSLRMRASRARGQTPQGAGPHRVADRALRPLCHELCRLRNVSAVEPAIPADPSERGRRLARQRIQVPKGAGRPWRQPTSIASSSRET